MNGQIFDTEKLKEVLYLRKRLKELMAELCQKHGKASVYCTISRMKKKAADATKTAR